MKSTMVRIAIGALAAALALVAPGGTFSPAFAQEEPTPVATPAATAVIEPTPTANPLPYDKQWYYEYRNSYLLVLPISVVRSAIESNDRATSFGKGIFGLMFPPLLANTPHKKLAKMREEARALYADIVTLDSQWSTSSLDASAALAKADELETRHKALLKAIERIYYIRKNSTSEMRFAELRVRAHVTFRMWMRYFMNFRAMPENFEAISI